MRVKIKSSADARQKTTREPPVNELGFAYEKNSVIVEDDRVAGGAGSDPGNRAGYQVSCRLCLAEDALPKILEKTGVVLMDIKLPGMSASSA